MRRWLTLLLVLVLPLAWGQASLEELNAALRQAEQLRQQRIEAARAAEARLKQLGAEVQRNRRELEAVARDITRLERDFAQTGLRADVIEFIDTARQRGWLHVEQ